MSRRAFVVVLVLLAAVGGGVFLMSGPRPAPHRAAPAGSAVRNGEPRASMASPGGAARVDARESSNGTPPVAGRQPSSAPPPPPPASSSAASRAAVPRAPSRPAAPPAAVTLTIEADVPGAQVFIDRQFAGASPLTKFGLTPGRHQINVTAPGYEQHVETLDLAPGPHDVMIRFRDMRLDARTDVVHRHGIGSCRGVLRAAPDGVRFESGHDDAFEVPLEAIEELQVDYLAGRLRLVVDGGRRYDFTHPDGTTDHLLVFEREVNRARERLRSGEPPAR